MRAARVVGILGELVKEVLPPRAHGMHFIELIVPEEQNGPRSGDPAAETNKLPGALEIDLGEGEDRVLIGHAVEYVAVCGVPFVPSHGGLEYHEGFGVDKVLEIVGGVKGLNARHGEERIWRIMLSLKKCLG